MPAPPFVHLTGAKLDATVLDNLKTTGASQSFISDTLNTALKTELVSAATRAGQSELATLLQNLSRVDIAASANLTLHDFVSKEVKLPDDPKAKAAAEAGIAQLSTTTTVGDLLGLNSPLNANPMFSGEVKKVGLATLLITSPALAANSQLINDFIDRYANAKGSITDFWQSLSADNEFNAVVPEIQFTMQLGTLTLDNPALISALRTQYPNIKSVVQLTSLTSEQWQKLIASPNVTVPASIEGSTPAEKASNYELSITTTLKASLPGIYFVNGLQTFLATSKDPIDQGVSTFLNNASEFDILNTNLNTYLAQNNQTLLKGIDPSVQGAVRSKVAAWQRVSRVVSDFPTANSLFSAGYTSAYAIASTPRANFLQTFSGQLGGSRQSDVIYQRSQQIASSAMTLFSNVRQALTPGLPRAIGDTSGQIGQFLASASSGIPNWQELFGSLSYCSCTDCRSVYSAAAYFVDLLQFLKKSGNAFDILTSRRPDLPYLKLNCENTNTTLPYVDLVNEILEGFVVLNTGKLDPTVGHNTPRNATASDLSVSPEYTNTDAYNKHLYSAIYPPTLPFDRWLTTARTYLNFMGSSLYELMSACQTGAVASDFTKGTPSGIAIACEYLGISEEECIILTGKNFSGQPEPASPPDLYQYYGYATSTIGREIGGVIELLQWEQDVAYVETFLQRTTITYNDLVALLKTRALNPNLTIMLQAPDGAAGCDLTQTTIVDLSVTTVHHPVPVRPSLPAPLTTPATPTASDLQDTPTLALMHRFIRLWKKLGWSIKDLDKTMTALKASDIDQQFLVSLSAVKQVQAALNIPLPQVLSFWANIDTDGRDSLYMQLFQSKAVPAPPLGGATEMLTTDPYFQLQYAAPLAALPTLDFPSPLFPNIAYDATSHWLTADSQITSDELSLLLQLQNDPSFTAAIKELALLSTWGAGVQVASLPALSPTATPLEIVSFDPTKQQISTSLTPLTDDNRALLNFSNNPLYQAAIDALYNQRTLGATELISLPHPVREPITAISDHINTILAALRINAQDLGLIRQYAGLIDPPAPQLPAELNLVNLSKLSRYAFLAQALGLSISDLLTLIALTGTDPFQLQSPAITLAFVQTVQSVQASPFSIGQLNYIYRHTYNPNAGVAPIPANVNLLLTTLQFGLAAIANADVIVPDPKGELLLKNLTKVLGNALSNAALGLINGTVAYSTPLAALPPIILPSFVTYNSTTQMLSITGAMSAAEQAQLIALSPDPDFQAAINTLYVTSQAGGAATYTQALAQLPGISFPALATGVISYDSAAQQLKFTGPMPTSEQTTLLSLSSNPAYQAAVNDLHQQPIDFINTNFATFLNPSDAVTQLIENPQQLMTAQKVLYVAQKFMPYLRQIQSESLVTQTLSDNLQISPQLCSLLLKTIINSRVYPGNAPQKYAMDDFLALVGDGLSATYNTIPPGNPLKRTDPTVSFDWGFGIPDISIATRPFSVTWSGYVIPLYSEIYTFYVNAGGAVTLSVNGQQLINQTNDVPPTEYYKQTSQALDAGQLYQIVLNWTVHAASAVVEVSWSSPSTPKAVIPQSQLFSGSVITSLAPITNSYTLLYKTVLLASTFPLTTADVSFFFQNSNFAGSDPTDPTNTSKFIPFDPNLFPLDPSQFKPAMFNQWQRLNSVVNLRNRLPGGDAGLLNIFSTAAGGPPTTALTGSTNDPLTPAIIQATGWNSTDLLYFVGSSGFKLTYADFANETGTHGTGLVRLQTCFALISRLGISAQQLINWATTFPSDPQTESDSAAAIQSTLKARYDPNTWITLGKPLNDTIREASKEALIAYILANAAVWNLTAPEGGAVTTSDQLYELFLIDVDMSPCMLTSRIVQANAAIQLFVQRCLLNLEPSVTAPIDTTVWNWMQNFRVWQAARQVFLYPENWMVPTLRDDMTPFFQDLENTLLQNPITNDTAEQAYIDYLTALNEVSQLDIRGTYWQLDASSTNAPDGTPDATNDVLHVFGRTTSQPYKYYYRRLLNCSQYGQAGGGALWTPWELVDVNIDLEPVSPSTGIVGDHLMPVVWDGRLYLFWLIFKETSDPGSQTAQNSPQPGQALPQPTKDLNITLAWSVYSQGAWSSKQTSPGSWALNAYSVFWGSSALDTSAFSSNISYSDDDSLIVTIYFSPSGPLIYKLGQFSFSRCEAVPTPSAPFVAYQGWNQNPSQLPPELDEISPLWSFDFKYNLLVSFGEPPVPLIADVGFVPMAPDFAGQDYYLGDPNVLEMPEQPSQLLFPQQFFPSFGFLTAPPDQPQSFPDQPFFYQDSQRTYFVTENFTDPIASFGNISVEGPLYSRASLASSPPVVNSSTVFKPTSVATASGRVSIELARRARATVAPAAQSAGQPTATTGPQLSQMLFSTFFHPFSCSFLKTVNKYGVPGLLTLLNQAKTNDNGVIVGFQLSPKFTVSPGVLTAQGQLYETTDATPLPARTSLQTTSLYWSPSKGFYWGITGGGAPGDAFLGTVFLDWVTGPTVFEKQYQPNAALIPLDTFPRENVDFSTGGAYSIYNWELFFHIPLLIATSLSQNQQFADAQKWFHYIFNPTSNSEDSIPQRYWNCLPFYECSPTDGVQCQIQTLLASDLSSTPCLCGQSIADQITAWMQNPFDPFLIGRMRPVAFRMKVVMAYLDNLIAWGDSLFAQNTRESINEATQIYVLAKEILGDRPTQIPQRGTVQDYTYNDLITLFDVDQFSNALVLIENDFPYLTTASGSGSSGLSAAISMSSHALYFCVPPNTNLMSYWDTVDDRLYKIRHCMNIQGQVQQLPLFAPPISPALLVAAAAAGVDLSSVLSNTNAGTPLQRFTVMVQKALELCSEVRSLGAALLSALEKKDAEALALLRATQETSLLQAMQQLKQSAVDAAQQDVVALQASLQVATDRQNYYNGLIQAGLIAPENQQMSLLAASDHFLSLALPFQMTAAGLGQIPGVIAGAAGGFSSPVTLGSWSTEVLVAAAGAMGTYFNIQSQENSTEAQQAGLQAQWARRSQEWSFQVQSATDEIAQINAQISAANIRVQMAQDDQSNLNLQIQNAQAVQDFLSGKFTNTQLYTWMVDQTSTVFFQCYQMAYDLASRAEAAFRFERGLTTSSYIQFGYWDSLKKGLLSGERLYADLKRMEIAYLETDLREFEISKSISLVLFDPWALIALKETGFCTINLPEAYFDMDYPGHYFRRVKTVSLLIPCVTGPYTSVNCTLTLLNSKVRVDSNAASKTDYSSDAHFITNYVATQSIATSSAQNDSGLFEVNFQDARYLPFEGAGLISTWQIELPPDCNAFDFETISDVVLNIKYTSRYGGDNLKSFARQAATLPPPLTQSSSPSSLPPFPQQNDLRRLFSLRHEFSSEWYKFLNPPQTATSQSMQIALTMERFPYQYRGRKITISSVDVFLKFKDIHDANTYKTDGTPLGDYDGNPLKVYLAAPSVTLQAPNATLTSSQAFLMGLPYASVAFSGAQLGLWTLTAQNADIQKIAESLQNVILSGGNTFQHLNPAAIDDIFMVCHYSLK